MNNWIKIKNKNNRVICLKCQKKNRKQDYPDFPTPWERPFIEPPPTLSQLPDNCEQNHQFNFTTHPTKWLSESEYPACSKSPLEISKALYPPRRPKKQLLTTSFTSRFYNRPNKVPYYQRVFFDAEKKHVRQWNVVRTTNLLPPPNLTLLSMVELS